MKHLFRYFLVVTAPVWAQVSPTINDLPSREFGQPKLQTQLTSVAPNLVEGRELNAPTSIAFDTSASPPIMYVVDSFNHRVLAWRNPANLGACGTSNPGCGFADLVIGQRDKFSTTSNALSSGGLAYPSAVAVDSKGNVYVADSGNNRILRFPTPFNQTGSLLPVDLVIGQRSVNSGNSPNEGLSLPTEKTLSLSINFGGHIGPVGMAFDAAGNLWVPDTNNHRVLRYPASSLSPNTIEPAADLVLGQFDFNSNQIQQPPQGTLTQLNPQSLTYPSSLAFDQSGRLYISDAYLRVLFYAGPFANGLKAQRILGVAPTPAQGQPPVTYPTGSTLGLANSQGQTPPFGVFTLGNTVYVADTPVHRIVHYDVPETWAAATATVPSPPIKDVFGQNDFTSGKINKNQKEPNATSVAGPLSGAFLGTEMWVVDSGNNRVIAIPQQSGVYTAASRVVGQLDFPYNSTNLIEGKELFFLANQSGSAGVVVDNTSNPPHLYVADSLNNRILGFNDARTVQQGSRADIVIGQPDLFRSLVNYPTNDPTLPTDSGLFNPAGLVVDANHNLYVADFGNGRVLRFPAPFSQPAGAVQHANLVLGQRDFFSPSIKDPSQQTMRAPFGVAMFTSGNLAVSDSAHNRVLVFKKSGGDFSNGQSASTVLGQSDFNGSGQSSSNSGMNTPRHIAVDTSDRLYVCDVQNARLLVFTSTTTAPNGAPSAFQQTGLSQPQGVVISPITGEIWVANTSANQVIRYPEFSTLVLNPTQSNQVLNVFAPLGLALDAADNLIVAEGSNRVTFFFAKMFFRNAANYNTQPLAPGMLAGLAQLGRAFSFTPASATTDPWPTSLSDLQIQVSFSDGSGGTVVVPAAIFRVDSGAIWFQVPMSAPSSGTADFQIVRPSTGQIVAAGTFPLAPANPGFFTAAQNGLGQVAARNDDQVTANGPTTPVGRGKIIIFYMTGQGFVPNGPADGAAPAAAYETPVKPRVIINGVDAVISYSGLGGFAGGWQINATVPESAPPGIVKVAVLMGDIGSAIGGGPDVNGGPGPDVRPITTTIAVK